jgi:hypothetical protein
VAAAIDELAEFNEQVRGGQVWAGQTFGAAVLRESRDDESVRGPIRQMPRHLPRNH